MFPKVYLAGPILGMTHGGANNWRHYADARLRPHNIIGISPLRCEPLIGARYAPTYEGVNALFGDAAAIFSKNMHDTKAADAVLCCLPEPEPGHWPSLGSICEIAWAKAMGKTVVLVSDSAAITAHPVIMGCVSKHVTTLEDGLEFIIGLLGGYAGGKNV